MPDLDEAAQNCSQLQDQSQVNIIVAVPKPCPVLPLFAPKIKVGVSTRPVHAPDDTKTLPDFFDPRSLFPFHPFPDPGRNFFFSFVIVATTIVSRTLDSAGLPSDFALAVLLSGSESSGQSAFLLLAK